MPDAAAAQKPLGSAGLERLKKKKSPPAALKVVAFKIRRFYLTNFC
jgi:hypothetical protein